MFYGNKSTTSLKNFSSTVSVPGSLEECLNIQAKPIDSTIENGAQVQQVINVECKAPFFDAPLLNVQFRFVKKEDYYVFIAWLNVCVFRNLQLLDSRN